MIYGNGKSIENLFNFKKTNLNIIRCFMTKNILIYEGEYLMI